jgi:hypothetical protein
MITVHAFGPLFHEAMVDISGDMESIDGQVPTHLDDEDF